MVPGQKCPGTLFQIPAFDTKETVYIHISLFAAILLFLPDRVKLP